MKTIAINSTKGGTGKSTLSVLLTNALAGAGYKCLAIDADMINHSLSFYYNSGIDFRTILEKNIFSVFAGGKVADNVIPINDHIDLLHGDVRLTDFRSTDSFKRLKRSLEGLDYDYIIIDTAPTFDNVIVNVFTASDVLLVPILQDIFNYQSVKYLFEKLTDLELHSLDVFLVFSQYDRPRTENKNTFSNQITDLFLDDPLFKDFISPCRLSKSGSIRRYINSQGFHLNARLETVKPFEEMKNLIQSVTGVMVGGEL
jgi:chromosome partitioning protein